MEDGLRNALILVYCLIGAAFIIGSVLGFIVGYRV